MDVTLIFLLLPFSLIRIRLILLLFLKEVNPSDPKGFLPSLALQKGYLDNL
jgi:hypothetical protein